MSVKFGVEKSKHRDWIDEQINEGVSARGIAEQLSVKFSEHISNVSISAYINSLTLSNKVEEKTALEVIEALTARVRNLEINACKYGPEGQQTGWSSYDINGPQFHSLQRMEVLTDAIPDSKNMDKKYNDLVASIVKRRQEEDGLCLDPKAFDEERAAIKKKVEEDAAAKKKALDEQKVAAAKEEIARREEDQKTLLKNIEIEAKNRQRERRLQELRDKDLETAAGIDAEGNPLSTQ